jgi:uncharacterized protein YjbI with pentapeptide repeats
MIIGFTAGPIIGYWITQWYVEEITTTSSDLARHLENGNASKFNEDRNQINEQIVLNELDLSGKDLEGANLNSIIILYSNLSNTNLQNSTF